MTKRRLVNWCLLLGLAASPAGVNGPAYGQATEQAALTGDDAAAFLKAHNDLRAAVGVAPLTWSDDLAAYSLAWVNANSNRYSQDWRTGGQVSIQHRPRDGGPFSQKYGENIGWWGGWPDSNVNTGAASVVALWNQEKPRFDQLNAASPYRQGNASGVGHYTQMIWNNTKRVGAAKCITRYTDNQGVVHTAVVIVADYDPPGNINGESPFPVTPPAGPAAAGAVQAIAILFKKGADVGGGAFTPSVSPDGKTQWVETSDKDQNFKATFTETNRDKDWVSLFDASRNLTVILPVSGGMSRWSQDGGQTWNGLCNLTVSQAANQ